MKSFYKYPVYLPTWRYKPVVQSWSQFLHQFLCYKDVPSWICLKSALEIGRNCFKVLSVKYISNAKTTVCFNKAFISSFTKSATNIDSDPYLHYNDSVQHRMSALSIVAKQFGHLTVYGITHASNLNGIHAICNNNAPQWVSGQILTKL